MEYKITIAGFGGQGVLFAGKVIANAALSEGYEVSWLPSYGPEMRGGTANCRIVISDKPVCSPVIKRSDALIAMNMPSLMKFSDVTDGVIITDERFGKYCETSSQLISVNSDICNGGAEHDGLINMIMVGVFAAETGVISINSLCDAVRHVAKGSAAERDVAAIEYGVELSERSAARVS